MEKATFNLPGAERRDIRDLLLSESLLKTLRELVPHQLDEILVQQESDDTGPVDTLLRLDVMAPPRHPKRHVFVGINGDAEAHLGRDILFCTRPLPEELADFARRHDLCLAKDGDWCRKILSSFERVVFLDRFHFAASVGFAPWARLALVDRFPIRLENILPAATPRDKPRVLLLDHRLPEKKNTPIEELYARLADKVDLCTLSGDETYDQALGKLGADIHLHHGFSNHRAATISPFDSTVNGIYTIVLPEMQEKALMVGNEFTEQAAARSYVEIAHDQDDAIRHASGMAARVAAIVASRSPFNPELRRHRALNLDFRAARFDNLKSHIKS